MDEQEIIETTETITEVADEVAKNSNFSRTAKSVGIGLAIYIGGELVINYAIKPAITWVKGKIKLRKQKKAEAETEVENEE